MPVARVLACKSTAEHCNHEARVRVAAETKKPDRRLGTLMQQPGQKGQAARKAPLARHDSSASIDSVASAIPSDADGAQSPTQPSAGPSTKNADNKVRTPRKGRHPIWEKGYFFLVRAGDGPGQDAPIFACCSFCCPTPCTNPKQGDKGVFKYSGSPSALVKHLRLKHAGTVGSLEDEVEQRRATFDVDKNTSLQRAFVRHLLVGCGLPFAAAEWKGLRDFIAVLQPKFKAPTRGKATRLFAEYADKIFDSVRAEVQCVLERSGACVSVAADAWQGVGARDFFAVMVSWIDDDFTWQQRVVAARPLGDIKDADAIMQKLKSVFVNDLGVDPASKIFLITLDNEAAGLNAARSLGLSVVRCSAHCVQIAVKRVLFYTTSPHKDLMTLIEEVRTIVRHFRNSTQAAKRFQKIQLRLERPTRVVILDGETWWNSTMNMSGACC